VQPSPSSLRLAEESLALGRAAFARRTLFHLSGSLVALVVLVGILLSIPELQNVLFTWVFASSWRSLLLLIVPFVLGWIAHTLGRRSDSVILPYIGLSLTILLEAGLIWPLLLLAQQRTPFAPWAALVGTAVLIAGLLGLALRERFGARHVVLYLSLAALGGAIAGVSVAGWAPTALIVCGLVIALAVLLMVGLLVVIPQYNTEQPVAATQALLAVAATLFWLAMRKVWQIYLSQE